jgi:DNA-binding MarR family transcriptional regulator
MKATPAGRELALVLERLVVLTRQLAATGEPSAAGASVLARLSRAGPLRLTGLAGAEGVSQPGMTQLVSRLEREGLVRRDPSTQDRRGVVVEVTGAGLAAVRSRRVRRAEELTRLLARLDPGDRTAITEALPALGRLLDLT